MDRRDRRRKRRVRNQIISYIVAVVLLAGLVTGGFLCPAHFQRDGREKTAGGVPVSGGVAGPG